MDLKLKLKQISEIDKWAILVILLLYDLMVLYI